MGKEQHTEISKLLPILFLKWAVGKQLSLVLCVFKLYIYKVHRHTAGGGMGDPGMQSRGIYQIQGRQGK